MPILYNESCALIRNKLKPQSESWTVCPLSKGNQAPHPKFEKPNGKNGKSKNFLTSVKNWCVQLT